MIIISILYPDINFVINVSYAAMYYNYRPCKKYKSYQLNYIIYQGTHVCSTLTCMHVIIDELRTHM